ncbi:B3 domain-containing protein Os06g0194400 isoform X1 [Zea mays]|uniref:TF-B3 domain-containing protein n=1 Tax=Zea mays TaxID=4577 RepID=A0A804RCF5_MAIZE|nr:uncharacterized protein LOC100284698 isoform X1 [Zea mays]|eukprot:XP_008662020.1 DNA binding protein isoform X1 [Zea mays]
MAEATAYEEQRRRQVEANKRKLEELQLHYLSAAVREAAAAAKPSPVKKRKARVPLDAADSVMEPLRRSGRLANLPDKSVHREEVPTFWRKIRRTYGSVRKDLENRVYATDEARSYAICKAEEVEQELDSSFPVFIKPMTQSHVTGGFWLGLPNHFCRKYLPKRDETITLLDEDDNESYTLYLALKRGLSAGWRGFAIQHKLVDGDCLVFQLTERTKFKFMEVGCIGQACIWKLLGVLNLLGYRVISCTKCLHSPVATNC